MNILFTDELSADDAIAIIRTHSGNWYRMEQEEKAKGNYHSAQSYKDMAYAAQALIDEIERAQVENYKSVDDNLSSAI